MSCPICDDTGWKAIDVNGVRRVVRCDCWKASLNSKLLADARIQERYAKCDLKNFRVYPNERLQRAVSAATDFAERFPVVERGLCFIGPHGIGKTHLAVGVLRRVIQRTGARGLFWDTTDLLRELRATYSPGVRTDEMALLRPVLTAELLVLDDLGKDRFSEWVEETLNLIINTRYNQNLPTIVTSNYEDTPSDAASADVMSSLVAHVGTRIHSRLHEMCTFYEYDGADYRHAPKDPGADDLLNMWKRHPRRKPAALPAKADIKLKAALKRPMKELGWSGGKAGT